MRTSQKRLVMIFILASISVASGYSQQPGVFSIHASPGAILPFATTINGVTQTYHNIGGGIVLEGDYVLPFAPVIMVGGGIGYNLSPSNKTVTNSDTLYSIVSFSGKAGFVFELFPGFFMELAGTPGYYLVIFEGKLGSGPFFGGEGGFSYQFNKNFGLGLGASYSNCWNLSQSGSFFHGLGVSIGARYSFTGAKESRLKVKTKFFSVFPVFYKYYDNNPIGEVTVKNGENVGITDVKVSLYIKQYMDKPKLCVTLKDMKPDEEKTIPLYALFSPNILEITEATKVMAQVQTEYKNRDERYESESVESMEIQNRNAMTWDDDQKAAAFIAAKDRNILKYAKNIAGTVRNKGPVAINTNFRSALAIFESLRIYNINYVLDPTTPFTKLSEQASSVDFLQFPHETLFDYHSGDCDDLSILLCSLLESIGIETAFVTVPGHIFVAFSTDLDQTKAKQIFANPGDLIFRNDKTWVPVEITMVQNGFLKAWETGAKEWREGEADKKAGFFPVHKAWETYAPVFNPEKEKDVQLANADKVMEAYLRELDKFTNNQIAKKANEINQKIQKSSDPTKLINQLGILYAQYGLLDKAEKEFLKIADKQDSSDALVNLGNLYYIKEDYSKSIEYYEDALKKDRQNPRILLGLAKANYELENYGQVKALYKSLEKASPELAGKYAYLTSKETDEGRASSQAIKEEVEWAGM